MIPKLIIFDLDETLLSLGAAHYDSLNAAIEEIAGPQYIIDLHEHENRYNGIPTNTKLKMLIKEKNLPVELAEKIGKRKQELTTEYLKKYLKRDDKLIDLFIFLKNRGLKMWVASNSIKATVRKALMLTETFFLLDGYISNEDVLRPKPSSEMYLRAILKAEVEPNQTLVVEDSMTGINATSNSNLMCYKVRNPNDVTIENFVKVLEYLETI